VNALHRYFMNCWYASHSPPWLLRLLAQAYSALRNRAAPPSRRHQYPVTIIVVGNITAGGAGKTPTVMALVQLLSQWGLRTGVISRGYGRRNKDLLEVSSQCPVPDCGDEPVLIHRVCACPVVVADDRVAALEHLLKHHELDVVIADDGLQHRALPRDLEICLVDGQRGLGNGLLLPAGPLRDSPEVLARVDRVLYKGRQPKGLPLGEVVTVQLDQAVHIDRGEAKPLSQWQGQTVQAVAGIGNPESFFYSLEQAGIKLQRHALADHQACSPVLAQRWAQRGPILMTAKDAVKWPAEGREDAWIVPMVFALPDSFVNWLQAKLLRAQEQRQSSNETEPAEPLDTADFPSSSRVGE
jgi:tetraacyldisaccharide 4'-kinase